MLLFNLYLLAKFVSSQTPFFPLQCPEQPVPDTPIAWPPRLGPEPWRDYSASDMNHEICVGTRGKPNVGCKCAPNGPLKGALNCNPPPGWTYSESLPLIFWCKKLCLCVPPVDEDEDQPPPNIFDDELSFRYTLLGNRRSESSPRVIFTRPDGRSNACNIGCSSSDTCLPVRTRPGCQKAVCTVKKQSVGYFGIGTCSSMARSYFGGRKRDVNGPACACNATYVSSSCCHADEGIVWESPRARLGEVVLES